MTLPVSPNAISLSQIQTEFGGSNPISISEYYSSGVNVPTGTKGFPGGVETTIPISGQIKFGNLHGSSKVSGIYSNPPTGNIDGSTWGDAGGTIASVSLGFYANGYWDSSTSGGTTANTSGVWGTSVTGDHYMRLTVLGLIRPPPTNLTQYTNFSGWQLIGPSGIGISVSANNPTGTAYIEVDYKIEIASDSAGTNIVSTINTMNITAQVL